MSNNCEYFYSAFAPLADSDESALFASLWAQHAPPYVVRLFDRQPLSPSPLSPHASLALNASRLPSNSAVRPPFSKADYAASTVSVAPGASSASVKWLESLRPPRALIGALSLGGSGAIELEAARPHVSL